MSTNAYNRSFKTKREEYEEKLKQRSENEQWIFGNTFGRPGGGAPLRDKRGNVISNLKTISNGNIFKYDAQEFTKGENNIYNINNKLYEKNNNDSNVNKVINDPFTPFRNYINQFDTSNNNNINQGYLIPDNNNLNQNPYLVQLPDGNYGILAPYPIIQQMPNINYNNINYPLNNINLNENIKEEIPQQRPYSSLNINNINNINNPNSSNTNISNTENNQINSNINNTNNMNNTSYNIYNTNAPRKFLKKIPESTLFNEAAQERIKLEKERKNDMWKKDLLEQIKEKRRREEKERRELEEKEKKDELENDKYMKYKKKQKEEHTKKLKEEQERRMREKMQSNQSQSVANILDLSNNIDQANKTIMSNNNITFREGNLNELSQNNINLNYNENEENNNAQILNNNNLENNNYNSLYNPIQENFKNEINRQYHLLNETLNHDINTEMQRISKDLENNYTPFTQKLLLMNTYSKSRSDLTLEQNKKLKKIENMIEEKKLVDYVLGNRKRPPTPKNEENEYLEMPVPSYFGTNRDKAENKYLGLHSKSSFINKGENISNFIASGRNQNIGSINTSSVEQNISEKNKINEMYNFAIQNDLDLNYVNMYYNKNNKLNMNSGKGTFGTNIENDENLGGVVNSAQNLDNISVFIPLNKDRENINLFNDKKIKPVSIKENYIRDKDMENMFKDLDKIHELTNKIDVTSKARNISDKFEGELTKIQKREDIIKKYYEQKEEYNKDINSDLNNNNNNKNIKNNIINKDKITEEASKYSKTSTNKTKCNNTNINKVEYSRDENGDSIIDNNNKESEKNSYKSKNSQVSKEQKESKASSKKEKNSKESYLSSDLKSESEKEREKEKEENKIKENKEENVPINEDKEDNINVDENKEENNKENNEVKNEEPNKLDLEPENNENKKEPEINDTDNKNKNDLNEEEEEEEDDEEKE